VDDITVEEIDIIVTAKVEEALKEFKKMVPEVKSVMEQVQTEINNIQMKRIAVKVQTTTEQARKSIKKISETNVGNELQQKFEKAGESVDEYQKKLDEVRQKFSQVEKEINAKEEKKWSEYLPAGLDRNNPTVNKAVSPMVSESLSKDTGYQKLLVQEQQLTVEAQELSAKLSEAKQNYKSIGDEISLTEQKQNSWIGKLQKSVITLKSGLGKVLGKIGSAISGIISKTVKLPSLFKKSGNSASSMGKSLKIGLKNILKYAGALFGLRSIYNVLRNSASSWLSSSNAQAKQLSANIEYMKYAMGSVFAPVIEYIINLVYKLMKAIQSVVYAFSGVNIFAKATASSMNSASKSASKTSKSLAGIHSEINNVSSGDDSGESDTTSPSIDLSTMDTQMSALSQKLYDFFAPLKESWDKYGNSVIQQLKKTATQVVKLISSVWGSFEKIITNGTVYNTLNLILSIIGNIAEAFANAWNFNNNGDVIIQNLANALNNVLTAINNVIQTDFFQGFLNIALSIIREISENIASIDWQPLIETLVKIGGTIGVIALVILDGLVSTFKWLVEHPEVAVTIMAIVTAIKAFNTVMAISQAIASANPIVLIIMGIIAIVATLIITIKNVIDNLKVIKENWEIVWNYLKVKVFEIVHSIIEKVAILWTNLKTGAKGAWEGIKNIFSTVATFFKNTFSNAWTAVKNVFSKGGQVFEGIKEGIESTFKTIVNGLIDGINKVVSVPFNGIKSALDTIRNVNIAGATPFSFVPTITVPQIPHLATGNVAYEETLAVFGEYAGAKSNPEITTPQNIMRETFRNELQDFASSSQNSSNGLSKLIIQFGSTQVALEMEKLIQKARRQNGTATATI
jgi:hypothetical protein